MDVKLCDRASHARHGWMKRLVTRVLMPGAALLAIVSCEQTNDPQGKSGSLGVGNAQPASLIAQSAGHPTTQEIRDSGLTYPPARFGRDKKETDAESKSCIACHGNGDSLSMHSSDVGKPPENTKAISCVDCHGGPAKPVAGVPDPATVAGLDADSAEFLRVKHAYHVQPKHKELWMKNGKESAANPSAPSAATLSEDGDYIRFVNPGDLRAAAAACGACHNGDKKGPDAVGGFAVDHVRSSMMAHGAMLWSAALYNNGSINQKIPVYGESYAPNGKPERILPTSRPTSTDVEKRGWLTGLVPLPRWEVSQPGNILRVFENGGRFRPIIGIPDPLEDPGRPDVKLSVRGFGTDVRTDPVFIGLQKTRLLDPTLALFGSNDHPGDFRGSGCSACHVVYGNDRSPVHSATWASFGNRGESYSADRRVNPSGITDQPPATSQPYAPATQPIRESGHPLKHKFEKNVPTSSCIVCHVHPGTNVVNAFLGFTWWDNETDGEHMYPRRQKYPTSDQEYEVSQHNPEGTAPRGLWSNLYPNDISHAGRRAGPDFLENVASLNPDLKHTQFADFHGHGWIFRAVFKQDRHGTLLGPDNQPVKAAGAAEMAASIAFQAPPATNDEDKHLDDAADVADMKKAMLKTQDKPAPVEAPVHLKDIHLEKGMQCVDCHFQQDNHGDGHLYGETRNAIMVDCVDCHGSVTQPPAILKYLKAPNDPDAADWLKKAFSGNAAAQPTDDQLNERKLLIGARFVRIDAGPDQVPVLFQKSALDPTKGWYIKSVAASARTTASPLWAGNSSGSRARYAHTVRTLRDEHGVVREKDGKATFGLSKEEDDLLLADRKPNDQTFTDKSLNLAHANSSMACYACHTSWNTSCFGCHLPMRANQKKPMLHNEGIETRNYTSYNYQTLRDDVFMLGIDSTVKEHKVVPVRSACAVVVSSQDANRQWIYAQQQTVSAEGFAGTAFSPYFPHTVRARETKQCTDCHVSAKKDNNAIMAQVLLQGTNAVNFIGRFAWVAQGEEGLAAIAVTERDEPQAVIGSKLHKLAYPDFFAAHQSRGSILTESHGHEGTVYDVQLRGEYLYAACGSDGFIAYDVANIDNKGFSERIITAPVSPLGQRLYVRTKFATSVTSPSTLAIDPTRKHFKENQEVGTPHPLYSYLYVTDREEGLVVIGNPANSPNKPGVATLLDGDPENNFLERAATYNPSGLLTGARSMTLNGHYAYICSNAGLVVVNLNDPLKPCCEKVIGNGELKKPCKVAVQFRYAFVCDEEGLKVLDVTDPSAPRVVPGAALKIEHAHDIYVCRTFGYVAAGSNGLVIVDLERPESIGDPAIKPIYYNAGGKINDANAVRVGMTNTSLFAYIADGHNGLRVVQLTNDEAKGFLGFSPIPVPHLIASFPTKGPALSLSKGLDRDRAVDENGDQLAVFGRVGARPFNALEQRKLYLTDPSDPHSKPWSVTDDENEAHDVAPKSK